MTEKEALILRGKAVIPGLTQLLSKRPDQFAPGVWPTYFSKASGASIWDISGNQYTDMSISGIGANVLGYCDPEVDEAVIQCIRSGNSSSLNAPEDVELAELLCEIHPWADKVRYSRTGGEALTVAIRIARAATGREKIVFCGYHGWHDWYLAANLLDSTSLNEHLLPGLSPLGVPKSLRGTSIPFTYNDLDDFKRVMGSNAGEVAAVIMEPLRNKTPSPGFLENVKKIAKESGSVLIFDEVSSGFRLTCGGVHKLLGVEPDIAVFAKAISNGYPMAAVIGRNEVMEVAEKTFISSTYWTDRIGPVAAISTIKKFRRENVAEHLINIGQKIQSTWTAISKSTGTDVEITGIYPMSYFKFNSEGGQIKMTYFIQEMLKKNILASNRFYANYAHTLEHANRYMEVAFDIFQDISRHQNIDDLRKKIIGEVASPGFHRLN